MVASTRADLEDELEVGDEKKLVEMEVEDEVGLEVEVEVECPCNSIICSSERLSVVKMDTLAGCQSCQADILIFPSGQARSGEDKG